MAQSVRCDLFWIKTGSFYYVPECLFRPFNMATFGQCGREKLFLLRFGRPEIIGKIFGNFSRRSGRMGLLQMRNFLCGTVFNSDTGKPKSPCNGPGLCQLQNSRSNLGIPLNTGHTNTKITALVRCTGCFDDCYLSIYLMISVVMLMESFWS